MSDMTIAQALEKISRIMGNHYWKFYLEIDFNADGTRKTKWQIWNSLRSCHMTFETLEGLMAAIEDEGPRDRVMAILAAREQDLERSAA